MTIKEVNDAINFVQAGEPLNGGGNNTPDVLNRPLKEFIEAIMPVINASNQDLSDYAKTADLPAAQDISGIGTNKTAISKNAKAIKANKKSITDMGFKIVAKHYEITKSWAEGEQPALKELGTTVFVDDPVKWESEKAGLTNYTYNGCKMELKLSWEGENHYVSAKIAKPDIGTDVFVTNKDSIMMLIQKGGACLHMVVDINHDENSCSFRMSSVRRDNGNEDKTLKLRYVKYYPCFVAVVKK